MPPSRRRARLRRSRGQKKTSLGKPGTTSSTTKWKYNVYTGEGPVPAGLRAQAMIHHVREIAAMRGLIDESAVGPAPDNIWVPAAQGAKKKTKGTKKKGK